MLPPFIATKWKAASYATLLFRLSSKTTPMKIGSSCIAVLSAAFYCRMSYSDSEKKEFTFFKDVAPAFGLSGKNVEVCVEPSEFYHAIMTGIANARKRIVLASLYLGSGKLEQDLVNSLEKKLGSAGEESDSAGGPRIRVLLDYSRGSRGADNSRHMLLPLLKQFGGDGRLTLSLYHTPQLRGYLKRWMPDRFNELLGVQHIKAYVFDDTLVLSGANLSNDYFTNRQDRCVIVRNAKELCDFFDELVQSVESFSMQVTSENVAIMHDDCDVHPYEGHRQDFGDLVQERVERVIEKYRAAGDRVCSNNDPVDTWIYPLVQMGPFGISNDLVAMETLLKTAPAGANIFLSTAYFNLTSEYIDWIVNSSASSYEIAAASPQANGFYRAAGMAGGIPHAYTLFERSFFDYIVQSRQSSRIKIHEYLRDQWTFHAKGLWWYSPGETLPNMTLVGSSNFGYRSAHRDLEAQVAIVTECLDLRTALHKEKENIFDRCYSVDERVFQKSDRQLPLWVWLMSMFVKYYA